jgi:iron(III) transport system substrate-binding protein
MIHAIGRPIARRAVLAGAALLPARLAHANPADVAAGALKEGGLTWYVAQFDSETAERMGKAFTELHPGVKVSVIRTTGQVAYERLLQDLKNNAPQCDVFSSTDIAQYPALKARGALAEYRPAGAEGLLPLFKAMADPGYFYPSTAISHLIIYNKLKVAAADAPKTWLDLLDPKWKGRVATGHPAFSGCTGVWVVEMKKLYGWEYFEKLARNNPRIGRSGNDPVTLVNAGEALVGPGPGSTSFQQVDKGNPIVPVYPSDGTGLCVGPAAVMAGAPHPNAARLFMEWLLGEDFAKFAAANHGDPVRPGLTLGSGQKSLDTVKVLSLSVAEIAKGIPEVVEQWRDTFGN